jgi:hypothetical protein
VLLSVGKSLLQMECLAFPFIDQGKDLGYTRERERENEEREKTEEKRALGLCRPSPLQVGPTGHSVDNEGVHTSQPCPSSVLQAGATVLVVVPLSVTGAIARRLILPRHVVCSIDPLVWSHTGIEQHSAGPPGAVGDVSA